MLTMPPGSYLDDSTSGDWSCARLLLGAFGSWRLTTNSTFLIKSFLFYSYSTDPVDGQESSLVDQSIVIKGSWLNFHQNTLSYSSMENSLHVDSFQKLHRAICVSFCARASTKVNLSYASPPNIAASSLIRLHEHWNLFQSRSHIVFIIVKIHVSSFQDDNLFVCTANELIQHPCVPGRRSLRRWEGQVALRKHPRDGKRRIWEREGSSDKASCFRHRDAVPVESGSNY